MLDSIDVLNGDPSQYARETVDWWVCELQARLQDDPKQFELSVMNLKQHFSIQSGWAKVLAVLSSGKPISTNSIAARCLVKPLEEYDTGASLGPQVIVVYISHLRKKLPPEVKIKTVRGFGYSCPPETCALLKAIMRPEGTPNIPTQRNMK